MSDIKELKEEELKKVNGGSGSAGTGILAENNVPEVGKLYNKEYSYYARVTAVDKMSDMVSYDIGHAEYDASVGYRVVHTIGNSTKTIWEFLDEWEYYSMDINWQ